jgi:hypothetical protein
MTKLYAVNGLPRLKTLPQITDFDGLKKEVMELLVSPENGGVDKIVIDINQIHKLTGLIEHIQ